MRFTTCRFILAALLWLSLGGCHQPPAMSGAATPESALRGTVAALLSGRLERLLTQDLPPQDAANLRADWPALQQHSLLVPAAEQARGSGWLRNLAAPDAARAIGAQLLPRQAALEQTYQDQWPIFVAIGAAWLKQNVNQASGPNQDQKTRINRFIDALTPWAQQAAWFDPVKARRAIDVAVTTTRGIDLRDPESLRRMDFDTAVLKGDLILAGARQLLSIYGLPPDDMLRSAGFARIAGHADQAIVRMSLNVHGQPFSVDMPMLRQDGRWYSADLLQAVRRSHALVRQRLAVAGRRNPPAASATKDESAQPVE
jgi:hypothetical protein